MILHVDENLPFSLLVLAAQFWSDIDCGALLKE